MKRVLKDDFPFGGKDAVLPHGEGHGNEDGRLLHGGLDPLNLSRKLSHLEKTRELCALQYFCDEENVSNEGGCLRIITSFDGTGGDQRVHSAMLRGVALLIGLIIHIEFKFLSTMFTHGRFH